MDKALLLDAARALDELGSGGNETFARHQAVRQYNVLLKQAKSLYPNRPDIGAIMFYEEDGYSDEFVDAARVYSDEFEDAARRLRRALELRPPGSISQMVDSITLPPDVSADLAVDLQEFKEAVALGLQRTTLLLAGSIAEALLLLRHSDMSERGPGLRDLLKQATNQRLFGRDTLRQLETLTDYRDVIHARAAKRNKIVLNETRIEHAVIALKQLCADLQDVDVRFQ